MTTTFNFFSSNDDIENSRQKQLAHQEKLKQMRFKLDGIDGIPALTDVEKYDAWVRSMETGYSSFTPSPVGSEHQVKPFRK